MQVAPSQQPSGQVLALQVVPPPQTPLAHAWPCELSQLWQKPPFRPQATISEPGLQIPVLMSTQPAHGVQAPETQVFAALQGVHAAPFAPQRAVVVTVTQVEPLQQPLAQVEGLHTPASPTPASLPKVPPSPPPEPVPPLQRPPKVESAESLRHARPVSQLMHEAAAEPQLVSLVPCRQAPVSSQQPSQLLTEQRTTLVPLPQLGASAATNPMTAPNTTAFTDEDEVKNDIVELQGAAKNGCATAPHNDLRGPCPTQVAACEQVGGG